MTTETERIKTIMVRLVEAVREYNATTNDIYNQCRSGKYPEINPIGKVIADTLADNTWTDEACIAQKIIKAIDEKWNPLNHIEVTEEESIAMSSGESEEWDLIDKTFRRWRRYHAVFQVVAKNKKTGKFFATENYIGGESTEPGYGTRWVQVYPQPDIKTKYLTPEGDYFREK
jgi:hypothetical protein